MCFILFDFIVCFVYNIVIEWDIFVIVSRLWLINKIESEWVWFKCVKSFRICVFVVGFIFWVGLLVMSNLGCEIKVIVIMNFWFMLVGIWWGKVFK